MIDSCLSPQIQAKETEDFPSAHSNVSPVEQKPAGAFPIFTQFSPLPFGKGWTAGPVPKDEKEVRNTIDDIIAHGFTGIQSPIHLPGDEHLSKIALEYAQQRGMWVTHHSGPLEGFSRSAPPSPSVYSMEYQDMVRRNVEAAMAGIQSITRLHSVFCYQDEPFHEGPASIGYDEDVRREFQDRYGYALPENMEITSWSPKQILDVLNFRSGEYPHGWRQVYRSLKERNDQFKVILTHDSHNTFGAGVGSHSVYAIDDVFFWGNDFSDLYIYDIYPYMSLDFRFGDPGKLLFPRIAMTHYTMGHMRNLAYSGGKEWGFWFETYNATWFRELMCEELRSAVWMEREMATTAVAQGANYLITGYNIPEDVGHWEELGKGLNLIQKAGPGLLAAPQIRAKACFLFPRTQYLLTQEEYYNVGLSYELILRSFGELDLIHEDQLKDGILQNYQILFLCDVKLLPQAVSQKIVDFITKGGIVIADCVPVHDEVMNENQTMKGLFGVTDASTNRLHRTGHYVPYKRIDPIWVFRDPGMIVDETPTVTSIEGIFAGDHYHLKIASPRSCQPSSARVLLTTLQNEPILSEHTTGQGKAYLLGFCLQDTFFETYRSADENSRAQLIKLMRKLTLQNGVHSHVWSSNPDIEASLRVGDNEAFLFLIDHEAKQKSARIYLNDLPFSVSKMVNVMPMNEVPFVYSGSEIIIEADLSNESTQIIRLSL